MSDLDFRRSPGVETSGSPTDNAVARFDGITGKIIQNSGVIVDDLNNVTIPGTVTINGGTLDFAAGPLSFGASIGSDTITVGGASTIVNIVNDLQTSTFQIGFSRPLADASGVTTLQNIDVIDVTTKLTIQTTVDALPSVASIQSQSVTFSGSLDVESASAINQDLTTDASAIFGGATINGGLVVSTTTATFRLPPMDTADRNLITAIDGDQIYNIDVFKVQAFEGGSWVSLSDGSGDVSGPGLSTDNALARFDGTTGKIIQNSSAALTDGGLLTVSGVTVDGTGLTIGVTKAIIDAAGITTLQNIDVIDPTTETTIENAMDTLPNVSSIQGQSVSISGSLTVESTSILNQDLTTDANVTFNGVIVSGTGITIGSTIPIVDVAGTTTLQNIDVIDLTTKGVLESTLDTLPNVTSVQGQTVTLSGSLTVEAASSINQDVTTDAIVTFDGVIVSGTGITIGLTVPIIDVAGTATLQNIDVIDATTKSTIETTVTTLPNVTSIQGEAISLSGPLTVELASTINQDLTTDANVAFNNISCAEITTDPDGLVINTVKPFSEAASVLTLQNVGVIDATTETTIENALDTLPSVTNIQGQAITFLAPLTVSVTSVLNQDISSTGSPTFTKATVVAAPTLASDLTNKVYVDSQLTGLDHNVLSGLQGGTINEFFHLTAQQSAFVATMDQNVSTSDSVTFSQVTVGNTGLTVGSSIPFSDAASVLTLQNVDGIDATTETTIENALDTLPNVTNIQGQTVTFSGSLNVESASVINQDLTTDSSVTFGGATINGATNVNDSLIVTTTTGTFAVPRQTTAERNLASHIDGSIMYNLDQMTFNRMSNGVWTTSVSTNESSTTDNALVRWDGTGATLLENSNAVLDDAGKLTLNSDIDKLTAGNWNVGASVGANNINVGGATSTVVIPGDLTVNGTTTLLSTTELIVADKNILINDGGTTAGATESGIDIEGDAGAVVGYFRSALDNENLEFKAPTGNVLTVDVNADETLTIAGSLNVEADSNINQDVTSDGTPTFGQATLTARGNTPEIRATTVAGLTLSDDSGTVGVFVKDGGQVGIGDNTPAHALDVTGDSRIGHNGNSTRVKILPYHFMVNNDSNNPAAWDETLNGVQITNNASELFCFIDIPVGYKATIVRIFCSDATRTVTVASQDITSGTQTALGSGNVASEVDITDENSTDVNYLVISIDVDNTSDLIFGGYVTIDRI